MTLDAHEKIKSSGDRLARISNWQRLFDLSLLYASKSGGVIVGLFVLPFYVRLLGPEAFGVVAVILSLQAFLLMLDLGTSTIVGRDIAADKNNPAHWLTLCAAETLLHVFYIVLLIIILFINFLFGTSLSPLEVVLSVIFFWSLTVQNVGQSALIAKRKYAVAGIIQTIGVLGRAAITIAALTYIEAELEIFLLIQALTATVQMMVTSWICRRTLNLEKLSLDMKKLQDRTLELAKRGKPLVLFGLAGAAVLQLDKLILPAFVSTAALTSYFLASVLCLTPISVLAGPINQYFFPNIVESIKEQRNKQSLKLLQRQILAFFVVVGVPSLILWLGRESIVNIWLQQQPIAFEVIRYVEILLPGIVLGALGYVPYNILIAHEDYWACSIISAVMTVVTLLATVFAAAFGSILAVCWIYTIYHSLSVVVIWWRASCLVTLQQDNYVQHSALFAIALTASVITITVVILFFVSILSR